jgi:L-lactate dehydrogenase complex protein LldG
MSTDIVAQFADSAAETVDSCTRTDPATFETTLEELVVEPAVGAPFPSGSVSLDDTAVDVDPSVEALSAAETGVVRAGTGIAEYGTITVESRPGGDELVSLYPPRHVVVIEADDILPDTEAAFDRFEEQVRAARANGTAGATRVLATGASATADMGELVSGVHGPTEVHVVVIES